MKYSLFALFLICLGSFQAQHSYDFADPVPPESQPVQTVSRSYYGYYASNDADIDYEFTVEGIFAVSTIYSAISRETIRESSKYRVENGFLFGVEKDSIPCVLEGDSYYFGIKSREKIAGLGSSNILMKISDKSYVLNFEFAGHYTPSIIEFKGKSFTIRHFTFEESTTVFNSIQNKDENEIEGITYITLEPTASEWVKLKQDEFLGEKLNFSIEKQ